MADLKLGTQIGGNLVWHQGILELNPVDDKLFYRDQEIMTTRGYQTMLGSIKFGTPNDVYDIESMSDDPGNVKRYLRKMRSGASSTIWHETINDRFYAISTGVTDTAPQFTLYNGDSATFQYPVYTNSPQSTLANSLARKDYVDAIDAKNVDKSGDVMDGILNFSGNNVNGINFNAYINTGVFAGNGDGASIDKANMQIRSWQGIGFSPTVIGDENRLVKAGENSIWFNLRNGDMTTVGNMYVGKNQQVYSPINKPAPGDLNAYNKQEIDEKHWIRVRDERTGMTQPGDHVAGVMAAYFTNLSDVTNNWVSGFTVKGWSDTYATWSIFAGSQADNDTNRLWFKHGRSTWLPSSRIYHELDKPTNNELNLVSRAGDTMTGNLTMSVGTSVGSSPLNCLYFDSSDGAGMNNANLRIKSWFGVGFGPTVDTGAVKNGQNSIWFNVRTGDMTTVGNMYVGGGSHQVYSPINKPNHNDVGATQRKIGSVGGSNAIYTKICAMQANIESNGRIGSFILTGGENYGLNTAPIYMISMNTRGYSGTGPHTDGMVRITLLEGTTWAKFYAITNGDNVELWMERPTFSGQLSISVLNDWGLATSMEDGVMPAGDKTEIAVSKVYTSKEKPTNNDLNLVSRAGDTMSGALTIKNATPQMIFHESETDKKYIFVSDGTEVRLNEDKTDGRLIWQYQPAFDSIRLYKPEVGDDGMGTKATSLATKAYVDTKVGTAVQSVTATGAVKSTGGINPVISLINATNSADGAMSAADKAKLDGLPSAAVNKTGDTMTGTLILPAIKNALFVPNKGSIRFADGVNTWFHLYSEGNVFKLSNGDAGQYTMFEINSGSDAKFYGSITSSDDIVAKGNVNVTGQVVAFGDAATGKTPGETGITTARFVEMLTQKGAFKTVYWVGKVEWNYAGNNVITDTGMENIHLAGCVIEVFGTGQYIIRITTPTTTGTTLGATANREFIYVNHGASYAPGWRRNVNNAGDTMTGMLNLNVNGNALKTVGGYIRSDTAQVMSMDGGTYAFVTSPKDVHLCQNSYWNGTAWKKYDDTKPSGHIVVINGVPEFRSSAENVTDPNATRNTLLHTGNMPINTNWLNTAGVKTWVIGCLAWNNYGNGHVIFDASSGKSPTGQAVDNTNPAINWSASYPTLMGWNGSSTFGVRVQRAQVADSTINGLTEGGNHGTLTLSNWIRTTGNTGWFNATHSGGIHMEDATWLRAYNNKKFYVANTDGDALNTSGGVYAAGNGNFNDVQIRSDERLKSNFEPILNALDKVDSLSGWIYDKVGKTTREAGIIAQRLKAVLPEATGTAKDSMNPNAIEYLTVSNSGVNALLVEAIKELRAEVEYLKSKLN